MRYIIRITSQRGKALEGWLHFDWGRGRKYPEWWGVSIENEAHTMTEKQMELISTMLQNNNYDFQVIRVL